MSWVWKRAQKREIREYDGLRDEDIQAFKVMSALFLLFNLNFYLRRRSMPDKENNDKIYHVGLAPTC